MTNPRLNTLEAPLIEVIDDAMERDKFMTAEEAVAYGLADRVVENRDTTED